MRIPGPNDLIRVAGQGYDALERAIALVPRLVTMVAEVDLILRRVQTVVADIEDTQKRAAAAVDHIDVIQRRVDDMVDRTTGVLDRTKGVIDDTQGVVGRAAGVLENTGGIVDRTEGVVDRTEGVVGRASQLTRRIEPLLDRYQPTLDRLEPMLTRLAETTSPGEVDAVVQLVNALPAVVTKLDNDILPVLDTLATVAPDIRDLLDTSKELNELIGSVPGLGRVKRKIEEKQEEQDAYRADEVPPSSPDRGGSSPQHPKPDVPAAADQVR